MSYYDRTHFELRFTVQNWWEVIECLRKAYGDNDPYQQFEKRPWFTRGQIIYVRRDLYDESFTTFLFLSCPQSNE